MPTQKCNCSCTYCYIPHAETDKKAEYTFLEDSVKQFIEELGTNKTTNNLPEIRFIGGEPYLELESMARLTNLFLGKIWIISQNELENLVLKIVLALNEHFIE